MFSRTYFERFLNVHVKYLRIVNNSNTILRGVYENIRFGCDERY